MDVLVTPIGASPLVRTTTSGPSRISRQVDIATSDQATASSATAPIFFSEPVAALKPVAAPGREESVADNPSRPTKQDLPKDNPSSFQTIKRFVFEHDEASGTSIIKLMDSKGNVVMQVPPEYYLRTIQILQEFGGMNIQASPGGAENTKLTGLLFSKKV
jgi:uncharacterized FlaG/YvyC family protein